MGHEASTKHAVLAARLRQLVLELEPGERLPGERQLAEQWGVARMTVRQALSGLIREGLVHSVQGRGTIRSRQHLQLRVRLGSFADAIREHELHPSTQTLECVVDASPPEAVAAFLGLGVGRDAVRMRRLRLGDGAPLALEQVWLPRSLVPDLVDDAPESLYHYLDDLGLLPDAGEESVVAGLPEGDEIRLLEVAASRPVLRLTRRALTRGRAVEYAEAVLPADRYELWFPVDRPR